MARTLVTPVRRIDYLTPTYWLAAAETTVDVANGNYALNDGETELYVHNIHATLSRTLTIVTPGTVAGQAIGDIVHTIPALTFGVVGPFPRSIFGDQILFDGSTTDVKVLPISVLPAVRE